MFRSYRTKLQVAFVLLGLAVIAATGWIALASATHALEQSSYDRLTAARETRVQELTRYFNNLRSQVQALSADESVTSAQSLVEVAKRGAARVFQSKTAKNGGLHYIRRLWSLAETLGIGIFPGNHPSTGLNVAAVAHLAAAWPGELLVGDFQTGCDDMIAEDILQEPVRIAGGKVTVPQGPGFGVQLDEAKLRKFRWE